MHIEFATIIYKNTTLKAQNSSKSLKST